MKLLWVKTDFLHPTTKGGHIRSLEMLKRMHARHEIHYVAFDDPDRPEGPRRSAEYSSFHYAVPHRIVSKRSPLFAAQLAAGLFTPLPVALARYRSPAMKRAIATLLAAQPFDHLVCDFLFPAPNIPRLADAVVFQHNVESTIWRRHAETAADPFRKAYFSLQARRMFAYEKSACRAAAAVVAVSPIDAAIMQREFGLAKVSDIPTGVDLESFAPPASPRPDPSLAADLVFVGSMDWMPNSDGIGWFLHEIFPLIRRAKPDCTLSIVGRDPSPQLESLARATPGVTVTGTVPDVRPYLWNSSVSIVPLRVGSGTRLKIYEAMAARAPVVSTSIGAEGLPVEDGRHILLANDPEPFANACISLLASCARRRELAQCALDFVAANFSWESVARRFENILETTPRLTRT